MQIKIGFGMLVFLLMLIGVDSNIIRASGNEGNHAEYESFLQYTLKEEEAKYIDADDTEIEDGRSREVSVRAFKVLEDGKVIILDARQEEILIFQNSVLQGKIDISFCIDPQYFMYENDVFIVFDLTSFGKLYYLDIDGKILKEIVLPDDIISSTIAGFYKYGNENYLITYDKELIQFPNFKRQGFLFDVKMEDGNCFVYSGENEWNLPSGDRQLFNPVYIDKDGCLYIEETTIAEGTEYIQGETYLLKLDRNSNEVMSMRLRLEEYKTFPDQYYDFCEGSLYILELFDGNCQVSKVTMCKQREESHIAEMEACGKSEVVYSLEERATNAITVTRTRRQVESEAYSVVYAGWTVNAGNKTVISWATLPKYIKEATVGSNVIGMPYCWGGYNNYLSDVLNKLIAGSMAGNVNTEEDAVSGPVGFDCSGFVSYCYGLGSHIITKDMEKSIALTSVDSKDMQSMDLLLKTGHAMLFTGYSGNYINVYESTTEGEQKTRAHSYTLNHIFVIRQYKAYTPW